MTRTPDLLAHGLRLLGRGELPAAEQAARAALQQQPANPAAHQLLGAVLCRRGNRSAGAAALRRALELDPRNLVTRLNLARALSELGDTDGACAVCDVRGNADLARMRGDVLKAGGRLAQAIDAYREALALRQDFAEAWNNLGNAQREARDLPGAEAALRRALALRPGNPVCLLNLGRVLNDAGRHEDAVEVFRAATRSDPANPDAQTELGATLAALGRHEESRAPLEEAARLAPERALPLAYLGLTLVSLGRTAEAEATYRRALTRDPKTPQSWLFLGILLEESNRLAELESLLDRARETGIPESETAVLHARLLKRRGEPERALEVLGQAVGSTALVETLRAQLEGEILDRLGDTAGAFAAFERMNRLRATEPAARSIDKRRYIAHLERLVQQATPGWVAGWAPGTPDLSRPAPAFLLGFPRSGTTLLDTFLLGHPDVMVLEESPLLGDVAATIGDPLNVARLDGDLLQALRQRYFAGIDALAGSRPGARVIDKSPLHLGLAAFIHRVFPDARFIFALRHPCDVVLSCFMQNLWVNDVGASLLDLRDAAVLYDRLMQYWERCRELLPLSVHTLRYESLVADREGELRGLLGFLGLDWNPVVLDHRSTALARGRIGTPSYAQVTESVHSRSKGRWLRYRGHFGEALPVLAPWIARFGYGTEMEP